MSKFKVGDWIKIFSDVRKIKDIIKTDIYGRPCPIIFLVFENEKIIFNETYCSHATVIDFIKTFSAEKLAKLLDNYFIDHNYKKEGTTLDFLAQPLTDEIVEQLGVKE